MQEGGEVEEEQKEEERGDVDDQQEGGEVEVSDGNPGPVVDPVVAVDIVVAEGSSPDALAEADESVHDAPADSLASAGPPPDISGFVQHDCSLCARWRQVPLSTSKDRGWGRTKLVSGAVTPARHVLTCVGGVTSTRPSRPIVGVCRNLW